MINEKESRGLYKPYVDNFNGKNEYSAEIMRRSDFKEEESHINLKDIIFTI